MSSLTDEERVIRRALSLMANRGYGWSKAIARAAETLEQNDAADDRTTVDRDGRPALLGESLRSPGPDELHD
jgi:hypothetical protein